MVKISIIVPVYNASKYISKCIDSILNQTYANFELLLINDGSKDDSLSILKEYEKKDNRVKVINQRNMGVAKTRNKGINISHGDYIAFIDNDDYIDTDYLQKHIDLIDKNDCDAVFTGYRRINNENMIIHKEQLINSEWGKYVIMAPWARIYRRSFLIEHNIEFLDYGIGEDVYFNLNFYAYNPKIIIGSYIGYNWYFNTKSVSNTNQRGLSEFIDILFLLEKIYLKYDKIDQYLQYYFIRYYIWYLLFSGKNASSTDFMKEYKRIKKWYDEKSIHLSIFPFSKKLKGESFKNRFIVLMFIILERTHLLFLFSQIYCRGD